MSKWPDVELTITDKSGNIITEVTCEWCGTKESVDSVINFDSRLGIILGNMQKTAEHRRQFNNLWKQITDGRLNLYDALLESAKLRRKQDWDFGKGYAGTSTLTSSAIETVCRECGQPLTNLRVGAEVKVEYEMPSSIPFDVWRRLRPPPRAVLGKLVAKELGGTIDLWLARISEGQYEQLEQLVSKTRAEVEKLNVDSEFTGDFLQFLNEFADWVKKARTERFERYFNAVLSLANQDAAHDTRSAPLEVVKDAVQNIKDKLQGTSGGKLLVSDSSEQRKEEV